MAKPRKTTKKGVAKKTATRANGTLKKGFKYRKGGKIVKAKKAK